MCIIVHIHRRKGRHRVPLIAGRHARESEQVEERLRHRIGKMQVKSALQLLINRYG